MTKNEAIELGKQAGAAAAELMDEAAVREDADTMRVRACMTLDANGRLFVGGTKVQADAFRAAYIEAFLRAGRARYYDLPDVTAAMVLRSVMRWIDGAIELADKVIAQHIADLSKNPLYAMEWSDRVFEAAAQKDAAIRLRIIVTREHDGQPVTTGTDSDFGVAAAVREATRAAMRGAQYPSRSTSQPSNLAKEYVTKAFAEFATRFRTVGQ